MEQVKKQRLRLKSNNPSSCYKMAWVACPFMAASDSKMEILSLLCKDREICQIPVSLTTGGISFLIKLCLKCRQDIIVKKGSGKCLTPGIFRYILNDTDTTDLRFACASSQSVIFGDVLVSTGFLKLEKRAV